MFNAFAYFIAENTTGGTDIFEVWMLDLQAFHREHGFERWMISWRPSSVSSAWGPSGTDPAASHADR
jgi:hypothetical protein